MLRNKTFAPEFCSLISNWFDMREQAPGANLLHKSVSGVSSLVCTEICFAGACFRSKLPRVYWLGYLPGSVFRERVSRASSFVCTGWSIYPGGCFGSVFQGQAPSCVPALRKSKKKNNNNTTTKTNWTKELKPQTRKRLMQSAPRICGSLISCLILVYL